MKELIAACGLDCEKCEARIATINNDDELRIEVAKKWTELNKVEIKKEDINCVGCMNDGVKSPFCDFMCPIRKCVKENKFKNCGDCVNLDSCDKIKMIISNNKEAYDRLKNKD